MVENHWSVVKHWYVIQKRNEIYLSFLGCSLETKFNVAKIIIRELSNIDEVIFTHEELEVYIDESSQIKEVVVFMNQLIIDTIPEDSTVYYEDSFDKRPCGYFSNGKEHIIKEIKL